MCGVRVLLLCTVGNSIPVTCVFLSNVCGVLKTNGLGYGSALWGSIFLSFECLLLISFGRVYVCEMVNT